MARYFFHIDGQRPHRDDQGEELRDEAAAWRAAIRHTRDLEDGFAPGHSWRLEVHDGEGQVYLIEILTHCRRPGVRS